MYTILFFCDFENNTFVRNCKVTCTLVLLERIFYSLLMGCGSLAWK